MELIEHLDSRLGRIEDKLDALSTAVAGQASLCGPCRAQIDGISSVLHGSVEAPDVGLVTRVDRLEQIRRLSARFATGLLGLAAGVGLTVLAWFLEHWR